MNAGFTFLPHTADVRVHVYARTLAEAFSEAAKAFTTCVTPVEGVAAKESLAIDLQAKTREQLLYDYLGELIYLKDAKHFLPVQAQLTITHDAVWRVYGTVTGDVLADHETHGDVKAPTYHGMSISENPLGAELFFVLDI